MRRNNILLFIVFLCATGVFPLAAQEYAPDFSLEDARGNEVSLEDFTGSWIHIDFSTDWCYWCHFQGDYFSEVRDYMDEMGTDFVTIAVLSQDEYGDPPGSDVLRKWTNDYDIEYVLADPYGEVTNLYPVDGFPTNVIVSPDGRIVHYWSGAYQSAEDFISVLEYEVPEMFEGAGY